MRSRFIVLFNMTVQKNKYIIILFLLIFIFTVVGYIFQDYLELFGIFGSKEELLTLIEEFGVLAPTVFVALVAVEVFFAPLPGGAFPFVGAIIFGPLFGILYSWIGNMIGAMLAFFIAHKFGVSVVSFFMPSFPKQHNQYNSEIQKHKKSLWIIYAIPIVPVDVLSFAVGLSSISFRKFVIAVATAFFVRMSILNFFGDALGNILFI